MRYKMRDGRYLVRLSWLMAIFLSVGSLFAVQSGHDSAGIKAAESVSAGTLVVKEACELICQGEFDAAGELIEQLDQQDSHPQLSQLASVVAEYKAINQQREKSRETAYEKQLAELEKFRVAADANDANDVNDVNDIAESLLAITQVCEFTDQGQKNEFLSDSFVKQTIAKAIDKAAEFESEGKWLDAYIICYRWLQDIAPDNEVYSDYAEQLVEKANIVASFQDSPCETSKERFQNVKQKMFTRAIDALQFNYVAPLDYRQMAAKAVKRCELLAEVANSSPIVREALGNTQGDTCGGPMDSSRRAVRSEKLAAWSATLSAILDEVNQSSEDYSRDRFIDIFEKVLAMNAATVQLPIPVLIAQFAEAALASLDSYTGMVWPRQVEDFEKMHTGEFTGIGIEISKEKGLLTVVTLLPDTPAYNSGLDAEDVIEVVDGVPTKDMTLMCAVKNITGPAGTKVTLTIRRRGEETGRDITITRAKITVPTIRGWQRTEKGKWLYMIDQADKIGYVRIISFSERTAADLEKVLDKLEAEGLTGLILDLRFNPGGLLPSAADVADKFVKEGLIVSTRPRFGISASYLWAEEKNTHPRYPLVILINRFSASASEIVAGALADKKHKRAILIGERTHGKGSVQGITHYPGEGAQLKYTMAYYHLPSGQRVESKEAMKKLGRKAWGIGPDIEVKLRRDEIIKMGDVQRDNYVLVKATHDNNIAPLKKHTVEETLSADPQLAVGVLIVKSKLIQAEGGKGEG